MGLTVVAKGLDPRKSYDCGHISYGTFIMELVGAAYGKECRDIFQRAMLERRAFSEAEEEIWNSRCNDDLDNWIFHSDCSGKFTPDECRKIYNSIKDLKMDMLGHNYGYMEPYNMLDQWKGIFRHCARRRVNLYFR